MRRVDPADRAVQVCVTMPAPLRRRVAAAVAEDGMPMSGWICYVLRAYLDSRAGIELGGKKEGERVSVCAGSPPSPPSQEKEGERECVCVTHTHSR